MKTTKMAAFSIIREADKALARASLQILGERNSLMIFLFHSIFPSRDVINPRIMKVNPKSAVTVDDFRKFIAYYREKGYAFVSPDDVLNGLENDRKYILITFDDGYYNNSLALSVLREFWVPATFFVSVGNVKRGRGFWWDVLWRERKKQYVEDGEINREQAELITGTYNADNYVAQKFGEEALRPAGDLDRPFTANELKAFSADKLVHIGNHAVNHINLAKLSAEEVRIEITEAQKEILNLTDRQPDVIAYPYGDFSLEVMRVARAAGLQLGFTVSRGKNYLPLDLNGDDAFLLKRFVLSGDDILRQCEVNRSDMRLVRT